MSLNDFIILFDDLLEEPDLNLIQNYMKTLNFEECPSFVYHRDKKESIIDPEVRKSKTIISKDANLLSFINDILINKMNVIMNETYTFNLARDYITFIKYNEGDFFEWHVDFEKIKINHGNDGFKEMHFIYCINGCEEGGQLLIKNKHGIQEINEACLTNNAVVFDKLMEHKGAKVIKGVKIIMTVDLYVTTNIRSKVGIDFKMEKNISNLLSGNQKWISFNGDFDSFNNVWSFIDKLKFTPFLQLNAEINNIKFTLFSTNFGLLYLSFNNTNEYDTDGNGLYEYHNKQIRFYPNPEAIDEEDPLYKLNIKREKFEQEWFDYAMMLAIINEKYFKIFQIYKEYSINVDIHDTAFTEEDYEYKTLYAKNIHNLINIISKTEYNPAITFKELLRCFNNHEEISYIHYPSIDNITIDRTIAKVKSLPPFFNDPEFNDSWSTRNVSYSYHCNETNYDEFVINYRYGIMRNYYTQHNNKLSDLLSKQIQWLSLRDDYNTFIKILTTNKNIHPFLHMTTTIKDGAKFNLFVTSSGIIYFSFIEFYKNSKIEYNNNQIYYYPQYNKNKYEVFTMEYDEKNDKENDNDTFGMIYIKSFRKRFHEYKDKPTLFFEKLLEHFDFSFVDKDQCQYPVIKDIPIDITKVELPSFFEDEQFNTIGWAMKEAIYEGTYVDIYYRYGFMN